MIRLHSQQVAATLQHIRDPDPYISCDLMDGRDAFLTMARDKHQEFSSLRRAKFSTLALLYELHNQQKDNFVYTCNTCKAHVETRWHCTVCEVSTLSFMNVLSKNSLVISEVWQRLNYMIQDPSKLFNNDHSTKGLD